MFDKRNHVLITTSVINNFYCTRDNNEKLNGMQQSLIDEEGNPIQ